VFRVSKLRILLPALAGLTVAAASPLLGEAQASRPAPHQGPLDEATHEALFHHEEAGVTLGAMIEIQRQRRALRAADAVAGAVPASGGWEAQLGAFGSADAAERQQARLPALPLPVAVHREGALFRLKSQAAEAQAAQGFCAAASAAGFECFVRRVDGS
jgi:cell division protein FtsN